MLREQHPELLMTMVNLALTYGKQGPWKEAEVLQLLVGDILCLPWQAFLGGGGCGSKNGPSTFYNMPLWPISYFTTISNKTVYMFGSFGLCI